MTRISLTGILFLALGVSAGTIGCGVADYIDKLGALRAFQKANEAYGKKEYEEAIEAYEEASLAAPDDDPVVQTTLRFFTGSSHHLLYLPTLEGDPNNDAHLDAALDAYEDTIQIVLTALADPDLEPDRKEVVSLYERYSAEQLAALYRDVLDDLEGAERYFERLIELDPDTPQRYYALADMYERFHDPENNPLLDKVIAAYERPVELNPEDPIAYRQVANLLNKYGRFDETMEWLGRARDVNAENPEGYYLISTYYWDKVYRDPDLTPRQRREYIELGIDQLDLALGLNDEYIDALVYKNLLLREKAKIEPRNAAAYIAEADTYRNRALALRDALQEAQRAAVAAAAEAAAGRAQTER